MRFLTFIGCLLLLTACQHVERPEQPEDLIALDKMADIMTEVYLGNAAKSVNNKIIRQSGMKLDSFVYKKYDIDSMQFVRSNAYYTSNLDAYNQLFQEVEKKLITLKEKNDALNFNRKGKPKITEDTTETNEQLIESPDPNQ